MAAITTTPGAHHDDVDANASYLEKKGLLSWFVTLDHKRIGVMYLISVTAAFLLGGIFALLVRAELFTRGKTLFDAETYNRMFSLHGVVMVFLFIIPSIPAAMGNIILPMQGIPLPLNVGTPYRFSVFVSTNSGPPGTAVASCNLRLRFENRNGASSPF